MSEVQNLKELQVANKLCPVSRVKIYKGAIIALSGAVVVLVLLLAFGLGISKTLLVAFLAWLVPAGVNAGKQFLSGVPPELVDELTKGSQGPE